MNVYLRKKNFTIKKNIISPLILILFIIFINLFQIQVRDSFQMINKPFSKILAQSAKSISQPMQSFIGYNNLKSENIRLTQENKNLWSGIATLNNLLKQNQQIKDAQQNINGDFKITLVQVIGIDTINDFILIDKGSDQGVLEKMPLISSSKVLYGTVFKTYKNFSQVMLISNQKSAVDVKIISQRSLQDQNSENLKSIYGAIKGMGRLSLYLDLVNSDSAIAKDDVLVTSALEGIYPKNLLVGTIKDITKDDLKPFQQAKVSSFFDISNKENLFVITDYMKK